ncbi:L-ascorbate metabolism protein UlaG (beta-lactamase superfamily) [Rhodoligotrophos appendicifer]|uniref:MBL fold metallo-hydrolase n=1 Tax=Rhodoligotrophos appendicifer TaxID=987056 RepID=UPI00117CD4CC|nr:MBL fold metallo-hydrolase [Rhodoligotrophos appendicifer]
MRWFAQALSVVMALSLSAIIAPAGAQGMSHCLAVADGSPPSALSLFRTVALEADQVGLTFVGHSTFLIETPKGVRIATDFAGYAGSGVIPDVVTMNHAHSSHYTDFPDPAIKHVLRGWGTNGEPAKHHLTVDDVTIRNVPTDIRRWSGGREPGGNSIFIFEVADLCIGHLGHLHHELTPDLIGMIGRLDVVLVPVDGTYTMDQRAMIEVLKTLRTQLVIPMHYFGAGTLNSFVEGMRDDFDIEISPTASTVISMATLPQRPKVLVLPGY